MASEAGLIPVPLEPDATDGAAAPLHRNSTHLVDSASPALNPRPAFSIRTAEPEDAPSLSVLAIQVWLHTYATTGVSPPMATHVLREFAAGQFLRWMGDPEAALLLAVREGHLLGFARLDGAAACPGPSGSRAELATLYVQAPFMGQGVGSALLRHAEGWARDHSDSPLWLTVNAQNARARSFYAKHGYVQVGVHYFELGADKHENLVLVGPQA